MKLRFAIFILWLLVFPLATHAASVAPATLDLSGDRGANVPATFAIFNTKATAQTYYLGTISFDAKDETGSPQFQESSSTDKLAKWITFDSDHVVVPARSEAQVPFFIHIPADVAAGSYQTAVTISDVPSEVVQSNGAVIDAKTAILVFLTVNGSTTKKAALLDFTTNAKGFQTDLYPSFQFRIQNQGSAYFIPEATITLKDMFGRVIARIDAADRGRVLPGSTRAFQTAFASKPRSIYESIQRQAALFTMGPVTAQLDVNPGEGYEPIMSKIVITYYPIQLMFVSFGVIIMVIVLYLILAKSKKT